MTRSGGSHEGVFWFRASTLAMFRIVLLYLGVADRLRCHATENRGSNVSPRSRRNVNALPDPQRRVPPSLCFGSDSSLSGQSSCVPKIGMFETVGLVRPASTASHDGTWAQ